MPFIRREWTLYQADKWTREDWFAAILSPFRYIFLTMGLEMFLLPLGFILLGVGIMIAIVMLWIIDSVLNPVLTGYEKKDYLEKVNDI